MKSLITIIAVALLYGGIYYVTTDTGHSKGGGQIRYNPASMYVIDGDTVVVNGEHIRLLAIDAPELHGKCLSEKTGAYQAKGFVQGVLTTNRFRIVRKGTGKYGRTLANLWIGNETLSEMLLDSGLARNYAGGRKPWCR